MYASDRCVVSTLDQALDIAAAFDPSVVGVTVDTLHISWDPDVIAAIERAGREGRIATYQVCDWKTPLAADVLLSRRYPGDGVIDFGPMTRAVMESGYDRDIEVEIFNADIWAKGVDSARDRRGLRGRGLAPPRAGAGVTRCGCRLPDAAAPRP